MSKSNALENDLLKLLFNGTPIPNLADNAAAAPLTDLWLSLHTANPGESDDQSTSEIAYTGYARVSVSRSGAGWIVTGSSVSPAAPIEFDEMLGGAGGVATHAVIGSASSGVGKAHYSGALTPTINVTTGTIPRLKTTSSITED